MIITDTAAGVRLITDPGVNVPLTDLERADYLARHPCAAARIVGESSADHGAARTVAPVADLAAMDTEDLCDWRQREITEAREIAAALDAEDLAAAALADAVATIAGTAAAALAALDVLQGEDG